MQDELALVREEQDSLCQQRRTEAAKQEQNDRLMKTLDEDSHQVAAKEQRLMEGYAEWFEAQLQVSSLSSQPVTQCVEEREC